MDDLDRLYHRLLDAVREGAPHLRERRFRLGDIPQHLLPYRLHRRELGFASVQQYERALARLAGGERGYLSADAGVHEAFRRVADGGAPADDGAAEGSMPLEQLLRQYGDAPVALAPDSRHRPDAPPRATAGAAAPGAAAPGAAVPGAAVPVADAPPSDASAAGGLDARSAGMPVPGPTVARPAEAEGAVAGPSTAVADTSPLVIPIVRADDAALAPASARPTPTTAAHAPSATMPFPVRPPTPVVGGTCPHCARPLPADRGVTFCPYCGENLTIRRCPACSTELEVEWRFCITCGREVEAPVAADGS